MTTPPKGYRWVRVGEAKHGHDKWQVFGGVTGAYWKEPEYFIPGKCLYRTTFIRRIRTTKKGRKKK